MRELASLGISVAKTYAKDCIRLQFKDEQAKDGLLGLKAWGKRQNNGIFRRKGQSNNQHKRAKK